MNNRKSASRSDGPQTEYSHLRGRKKSESQKQTVQFGGFFYDVFIRRADGFVENVVVAKRNTQKRGESVMSVSDWSPTHRRP
jgi:hypothetical protein